MENNIIYTCITSNYDKLWPISAPCRAIVFSDKQVICDGWEWVKIDLTPKVHRAVKILPSQFLPEHKKSVWMDANLRFMGDFEQLLSKSGFWCMEHPERDNIIDEAAKIVQLGKDTQEMMDRCINRYQNAGLVATGVLIRENTVVNRAFGLEWWREVATLSHRDQMSFCWVAENMKLKYNTMPFLHNFIKYRHALGSN